MVLVQKATNYDISGLFCAFRTFKADISLIIIYRYEEKTKLIFLLDFHKMIGEKE